MKKLFTLLTMLLVGIGSSWAGPANVIPGKVYTIKALFSTTSYDLYLGESGGNLTFTSNISSDGSSYWIALSTGNKSYPIKFMSLSCPNKFLSPKTYGLTTTGGKFKMANCTTAALADYTQLYGTYDETDETNNLRNIGTWCYGTKNFYGFGNSNDQHPGCYASEHSDDYYTTVYDISEVTLNEGELRNRAETIAKAYLITNQSDLIVNTVQFDGYWTCPSEGSLAYLIDGLSADNNFWHSNWESNKTPYNTTNGTNYLGVNIPDVDYATITFSRRGVNGDQITRWSVYGFDENKAAGCEKSQGTKLAEFYTPLNAINETNVVSPVFATKGFTNIRFYCEMTDKTGDGGSNRGYFHLSEFQINGKFETSGTVLTSASSALSSALTTMRDNPTEANLTALTNAYNDYKDAEDLFYAKEFAKNDVVAKGLYTYTEDNESKSSGYPVSIDACTSVSNVNTLSGTLHRRDPSSGDGDFFRIRNAKTGRFLKASSETALALVNENDATGNDCVWTKIGNKLKNIQTGKYLAETALNTTGDNVVIDNAGNYNNNYYKILSGSKYLRNETSTALSSVSDTNTDPVGCAWSLVDATIHVTYNFTYNSSSKPVSVKACPGDSKSTAVSAAPSYGVTFDAPTGSFSADDDYTVIDIPCTLVNDYPIAVSSTYDESKSYFLKQRKNDATSSIGYAFYDSNRTANGIEKTEAIGCTNNYLWKFVGNPLSGYQIYNVAKGVDYNLTCSSTNNSITWSENPTYFEMEKMDTEDNYSVTGGKPHVYFKLKGSTSNTLHDLNNILTNWTGSGSVTDAGSILGFYEAEEYDIKITGNVENGRIIINGNEYANGSNFCCQKNTEFIPTAKPISNYQAHEISISGNTISVEYYEVDEYEIEITGNVENGRIIINDVEYANGQMFYNPKDAEFTPSAKIISYYHAGDISISENTISLDYTEITVPDGYNGFIAGKTNINADDWKTQSNWKLSQDWVNSPGIKNNEGKGMWNPIYLQGITGGTVPALEGWNFRMMANHSTYTIESVGKIQGGQDAYITLKNNSEVTMNFGNGHTYPLTVNLEEGNNNILNFHMSNGYKHSDCAETKCTGQITVNYGSVSKDTKRLFKAKNTSSKHVNTLILNAALTTPTEYNTLETITLATFDNVSCHTLTTNILDNEGWTESTNMDDLQHPSVAGKYYFVQEISSGVTLYTYMPKTYDVTGVETLSEIVDYKTYTIFNIPDGSTLILDEELEENQVINAEAITSVIQINDGITLNIDNITNTQFPTITGDGTLNINMSESEVMAKLNGNASCTLVDVLSDDQIAVGALKINDAEKYTIDGYDYYISQDESTKDVVLVKHYTRNVTSGNFGSICLPNGSLVSQMTGVAKVLKVTKITTDRVVMDEVDEMVAGVPYIFKSNDAAINLTLKGETVAEPNNGTQNYLVGNFAPADVPNSDNDAEYNYYILQSNQFKKVTSGSGTIKSGKNRCYLKVGKSEMSRQSTLGIAVDESGATGIDVLNSLMNNDAEIYDLNGRRLNDLRKGINIVNGVKVIVK